MSADATTVVTTGPEPAGQAHAHHGPTDKHYVRVAVILAVVTAAEVGWSYWPIWDNATGFKAFAEVAGLLLMMAFKFSMVAAQFMHLKFDSKVLTRIFYSGLFLAAAVYLTVLVTFEIFGNRSY